MPVSPTQTFLRGFITAYGTTLCRCGPGLLILIWKWFILFTRTPVPPPVALSTPSGIFVLLVPQVRNVVPSQPGCLLLTSYFQDLQHLTPVNIFKLISQRFLYIFPALLNYLWFPKDCCLLQPRYGFCTWLFLEFCFFILGLMAFSFW